MIASFKPCRLHGNVYAPPSKSLAHRYLLGAALSGKKCVLNGFEYSEDILASIDCLKALGVNILVDNDTVTVDGVNFLKNEKPVLNCRESGSTLRFLIPLCLTLKKEVVFCGSERLFERPLDVYNDLCKKNGFAFERLGNGIKLCGDLKGGAYKVRGDVSSQFITGLIFALVYLNENSSIEIIPPFESRSYVNLTLSALKLFGADVSFTNDYTINVKPSVLHEFSGKVEGDYSNAAFLDAFNYLGSDIAVENLNCYSLQGDKVYKDYFKEISTGTPTLDISDCPDLGPVLFALAALKNGAVFTGTDRLKVKESDRANAMYTELSKLGGSLVIGNNVITVPKQKLKYNGKELCGHNDHRIVMALSVILSQIGGRINGAEAVNKSYPSFFDDIIKLGAKVELL